MEKLNMRRITNYLIAITSALSIFSCASNLPQDYLSRHTPRQIMNMLGEENPDKIRYDMEGYVVAKKSYGKLGALSRQVMAVKGISKKNDALRRVLFEADGGKHGDHIITPRELEAYEQTLDGRFEEFDLEGL
jgi:hypothetical protein